MTNPTGSGRARHKDAEQLFDRLNRQIARATATPLRAPRSTAQPLGRRPRGRFRRRSSHAPRGSTAQSLGRRPRRRFRRQSSHAPRARPHTHWAVDRGGLSGSNRPTRPAVDRTVAGPSTAGPFAAAIVARGPRSTTQRLGRRPRGALAAAIVARGPRSTTQRLGRRPRGALTAAIVSRAPRSTTQRLGRRPRGALTAAIVSRAPRSTTKRLGRRPRGPSRQQSSARGPRSTTQRLGRRPRGALAAAIVSRAPRSTTQRLGRRPRGPSRQQSSHAPRGRPRSGWAVDPGGPRGSNRLTRPAVDHAAAGPSTPGALAAAIVSRAPRSTTQRLGRRPRGALAAAIVSRALHGQPRSGWAFDRGGPRGGNRRTRPAVDHAAAGPSTPGGPRGSNRPTPSAVDHTAAGPSTAGALATTTVPRAPGSTTRSVGRSLNSFHVWSICKVKTGGAERVCGERGGEGGREGGRG